MANFELLNKGRLRKEHDPIYGSDDSYGFTGVFQLLINGLKVKCIACDVQDWQHVSVSIHGSTIPPSWSIMCHVKELFFEPEDCVIQYHPPKSEYVNVHPGVLHLWRPLKQTIPMPPKEFV